MFSAIFLCVLLVIQSYLALYVGIIGTSDKKQRRVLILTFVVTLLLCLYTGYKEWDSSQTDEANIELLNSNTRLLERIDTLSSELIKKTNELSDVNAILAKVQEERHREVLGGDVPPAIKILATFGEERFVENPMDVRFTADSLEHYWEIQIILENNSKYFLKSVEAVLSGYDLYSQQLFFSRLRKRGGLIRPIDMLALNKTRYELEKNLTTLSPSEHRIVFVRRIPLRCNEADFHLEVEWSNGFYEVDLQIVSNVKRDYDKREFNPKGFQLRLRKPKFKVYQNINRPSYQFCFDSTFNHTTVF